jgi:hypothetical protein
VATTPISRIVQRSIGVASTYRTPSRTCPRERSTGAVRKSLLGSIIHSPAITAR